MAPPDRRCGKCKHYLSKNLHSHPVKQYGACAARQVAVHSCQHAFDDCYEPLEPTTRNTRARCEWCGRRFYRYWGNTTRCTLCRRVFNHLRQLDSRRKTTQDRAYALRLARKDAEYLRAQYLEN